VIFSSQVINTTDEIVSTALYKLVGYPPATISSGSAVVDCVYVIVPRRTAPRYRRNRLSRTITAYAEELLPDDAEWVSGGSVPVRTVFGSRAKASAE
jgi:hypothetical protein